MIVPICTQDNITARFYEFFWANRRCSRIPKISQTVGDIGCQLRHTSGRWQIGVRRQVEECPYLGAPPVSDEYKHQSHVRVSEPIDMGGPIVLSYVCPYIYTYIYIYIQ